jgi:Zincin-like metallopeptidase
VVATVSDLEAGLSPATRERLGLVEYAVEEAPLVPDDWSGDQVPLSALVRGGGTRSTRLVVFRKPIEHRCESRTDLAALVRLVLVEQIADLLNTTPEAIDSRYADD